MVKSRTEKVAKNVFFNILVEAIKLACGLILPRLILSSYGSSYNGIVQSVTQFLTCIALMKMGIGGATRAALYKPLAEKNNKKINSVIASTELFMRKIAIIFVAFVLVFACLYPLLVSNEFGWAFSFFLIIVISISTFAEYYFGFTYQMLTMADQKEYIYSILSIVTIVLNTIVSVILINNNFSIHIVKLGSSLVNVITPLYLYVYCHRHYKLEKVNKEDIKPIPQRWDAFAHEIASFVNDNTDIMILTIFVNLLEVSVYTVYHYVTSNLKKIVTSFTTGFGPAFGDMYARNEQESMRNNLDVYELMVFSFVSIVYSTTLVMIIPFVLIYTKDIEDVNYYRLIFSIVITFAGAFDCFRYPYKQVINNTGHYKQTRNIAITEAIINIVVSIIMVIKFDLVGVSIGTLFAMVYGYISYSNYLSNHIIERNNIKSYVHVLLTIVIMVIVYFISKLYIGTIDTFIVWIIYGFITAIISLAFTVVVDYVFYRESLFNAYKKFKKILRKKLKYGKSN